MRPLLVIALGLAAVVLLCLAGGVALIMLPSDKQWAKVDESLDDVVGCPSGPRTMDWDAFRQASGSALVTPTLERLTPLPSRLWTFGPGRLLHEQLLALCP